MYSCIARAAFALQPANDLAFDTIVIDIVEDHQISAEFQVNPRTIGLSAYKQY
jgi:hypothetical protein